MAAGLTAPELRELSADELATRLREYCISMPVPGPERMFSQVYAEPTAAIETARADFLAYHASFAGGEQ